MTFFGYTISKAQPLLLTVEPGLALHITGACLCPDSKEIAHLFCVQDKKKFAICHIDVNDNPQTQLNYVFNAGEQVHFVVDGQDSISLTGYYQLIDTNEFMDDEVNEAMNDLSDFSTDDEEGESEDEDEEEFDEEDEESSESEAAPKVPVKRSEPTPSIKDRAQPAKNPSKLVEDTPSKASKSSQKESSHKSEKPQTPNKAPQTPSKAAQTPNKAPQTPSKGGDASLKCDLCGKTFKSEAGKQQHQRDAHKSDSGKESQTPKKVDGKEKSKK
ncbi:hypothetical protein BLNAU_4470 [Blattamonas nauphoetae]|uniref:C2H2-type domain-containing protein n=1 Tax=Blattamonas nauphoetae TaxID=2049346 RepID=A0ABQ9Y9X4_9EUKA|nr:hypothetical protein BLNAU_4470 [Blattamonas nauphoetae]